MTSHQQSEQLESSELKRGVKLVITVIGFLLGVISILNLVELAFNVGFISSLDIMLTWYDHAVAFVMSPFEPPLRSLIRKVADRLNLNIELHAHWKHIFVLLMVYFGARARTVWRAGLRATAAFLTVLGLLIAIPSSAFAGAIPLGDSESSQGSNLFVLAVALGGLFIFELTGSAYAAVRWPYQPGDNWLKTFLRNLRGDFTVVIVGAIALVLSANSDFPLFRSIANPGLAFLSAAILAVSVYWILANKFLPREQSPTSWWREFRRSNNARFGLAVLAVFLGVAVVLVLNAGLSLIDL